MPDWLRLALAVLACYRLARLVSRDTLTDGLRGWAVNRAVGKLPYSPAWLLAEWLHCSYCLGVWLAVPCAVLVVWPTFPGDILLAWLGIAGGQALIQRYADGA